MSAAGDDWPARRAAIVSAMGDVAAARRRAEAQGAGFDEITPFLEKLDRLRRRYLDGLPTVLVARDPFDGTPVSVAMDTAGLDGAFWDAENPVRPAEDMPASFVVLSGALRLSPDHLELTTHLCLPGPPVPFVVPELLGRDGVQAVLATVGIGGHTGYAISYFSPRPTEPPPLPNEWGRR